MNDNDNQRNGNRRNQDQNGWFYAAGAAGVAAAAGLTYWLTSGSKKTEQPESSRSQAPKSQPAPSEPSGGNPSGGIGLGGLVSLLQGLAAPSMSDADDVYASGEVTRNPPPSNPCITNLNGLLADIHVRYIQLQDHDFQLHYKVCNRLFDHLHNKMAEIDPYYNRYKSTRQFAGSHYDNLRIKKPDEFDIDIVIRLPLNLSEAPNRGESDILIEPQAAGYVHLRMGAQFQNLPMRDGADWQINKTAYKWMDSSNFLCRSKFMDWWKKIVNLALNTFQHKGNVPIFYIDGVEYEIDRSESGPAMTLYIKNQRRGFKLDLDLVPALKFPESRWPISTYYRQIPPHCCKNTWMVVGKTNKAAPKHEQERSWRIALHNQEGELMHDCQNLKQTIRFMKKLRDELQMKKIASYYIKILFFWEIVEQNNNAFWRNSPAYLFTHMVKKLHAALVKGNIPYFWNKRNNLIGNVDQRILNEYAAKLVPLIKILDNPNGNNYKLVAKYLLTDAEFKQYNAAFLHI